MQVAPGLNARRMQLLVWDLPGDQVSSRLPGTDRGQYPHFPAYVNQSQSGLVPIGSQEGPITRSSPFHHHQPPSEHAQALCRDGHLSSRASTPSGRSYLSSKCVPVLYPNTLPQSCHKDPTAPSELSDSSVSLTAHRFHDSHDSYPAGYQASIVTMLSMKSIPKSSRVMNQ